MRTKILIAALLPSLLLLSIEVFAACNYAPNGFYCCTTNGACNAGAGEVDVFHMYNVENSHAELATQSNYPYRVCCGGMPGLGTSCSGTYDTLLKLSSPTNAHVEKKTLSNYAYPVCLSIGSGPASCEYTTADCSALGADYICIATISADTNAHVADCDGVNDFTTKVCCSFGYPPCRLTSTIISPNCLGGASATKCEEGETILMSATTTGDCSETTFFQIDASGGCSVQYLVPPGDVSGVSDATPDVVSGSVTGTWAIPTIPLACSGQTVTATAAAIYNTSTPQSAGLVAMNLTPYVTGSFTFKDIIAPTTIISPDGNAPLWSNTANIPFSLICTDTGGGSCLTTYYKIIASTETCAAGVFSTGLSGAVPCSAGSICQNRVCFYSTDTDGNIETPTKMSNIFQIDRTLPVVDVSHSPLAPTDLDLVTFTATASDTGSGLSQINIYVDGSPTPIVSCATSPCTITPPVPYSTGPHTYFAAVTDAAGNVGQSATKSFTVSGCTLTSATITPNCAGECTSSCEIGESISMSATTTGNCGAIKFFQIDASGTGCIIEYSGGDVSGVWQANPTIGSGTVTGTWTITDIPDACSGKSVTASAAGLYNPGPPSTGLVTMIISPLVTGSFTFKDITPPTTSINPTGSAWTNVDILFTLTCTPAGSPCSTTLYKIINDGELCTGGVFSAGLSGTVTCPANTVCQKRVCYYSNDTSCNTEDIKTSNVFLIDKAPPTALLTQPSGGWTTLSSIPVAWSGSDSGTGTIASFNVQSTTSWADGTNRLPWADWYSGPGSSATFSGALNNYTYYFQVRATDSVGNIGAYSAERNISVDLEKPSIIPVVINDPANSRITIGSSAWDGVSGIYNHSITCFVIYPDMTLFQQCSAGAAPFGGISTCQLPSPIEYTQDTEITCTLWARDRAGNEHSTGAFFSPLTEHPLIVFVEHSAFINIGETYHARVYVRNLKSSSDMINISIGGTYPEDYVTFLQSSIIAYMSPDKRNITVALNSYEQRILNIKVVSADTEQYTLGVFASSNKYNIQDSDTMNISIGFPASFPGIELLSIAALLSLSCFAYFRHLRKPK